VTRYQVRYTAVARRALASLPEKIATAAIEFIVGPLAENPHRLGKQLLPPLHPLYAARRGEYRVVYEIFDDIIQIDVIDVAHRRDIYRRR
jgi:mRNA interferase RelE/StbE